MKDGRCLQHEDYVATLEAIIAAGGNRTAAARALGICNTALYWRVQHMPAELLARLPATRAGRPGRPPKVPAKAREPKLEVSAPTDLRQREAELWRAHQAVGSPETLDRLARFYLPAVDRIVSHHVQRLPLQADLDAILSNAHVALFDCLKRYDPTAGVYFLTFATHRIRGAVLDALRAQDQTPRTGRALERQRLAVVAELRQQLGHEPNEEEQLEALGWDRERFDRSQPVALLDLAAPVNETEGGKAVTRADLTGEMATHDPEAELDLRDRLRQLFQRVTLDQAIMLYLRFWKGATLATIGEALGFSESRISQVMKDLFEQLRTSESALELLGVDPDARRLPADVVFGMPDPKSSRGTNGHHGATQEESSRQAAADHAGPARLRSSA